MPPNYMTHKLMHNPVTAKYPHSTTEAGISRTHNPTYASYLGDGSGRDAYIILDNGGLTKEMKPSMMQKPKGFRSPRDMRPMVSKPTASFNYKSDGTGRDSYVI